MENVPTWRHPLTKLWGEVSVFHIYIHFRVTFRLHVTDIIIIASIDRLRDWKNLFWLRPLIISELFPSNRFKIFNLFPYTILQSAKLYPCSPVNDSWYAKLLISFFFYPSAKLEMQSYNKTLKRFKGILSQNFLACELRGRKRGRFIGRVSIKRNIPSLW